MKKTVATVALLTIGGATILAGQSAQATEVGSTTTNGTVLFTENDGVDGLIKPGTENTTIKLEEGASTKGSLRLTNVPHFRFGSVKVSAQAQNYPSLLTSYQTTTTDADGVVTPSGTDVKIPQFVQVADERGKNGIFKVTATATNFTEQGVAEEDTADVLENTRIQFYSQKLTNNVLDKTSGSDITTILSGIQNKSLTTTAMAELNSTPLTVLSTTTKGANASISSVVFDGSYDKDKDYSTIKDDVENKENDQVKLHVPTGESPKSNVTYSSTITWSLTDAL